MYDKKIKSVTSHTLSTPSPITPSRTHSPLERDVLYGRFDVAELRKGRQTCRMTDSRKRETKGHRKRDRKREERQTEQYRQTERQRESERDLVRQRERDEEEEDKDTERMETDIQWRQTYTSQSAPLHRQHAESQREIVQMVHGITTIFVDCLSSTGKK